MMKRVLVAIALLTVSGSIAFAQDEYRQPDPALTALVDAPMQPASAVAPDKRRVATFEWKWVLPLAEVAREELKLAGLRITPATFSRARSRSYDSIPLHDLEQGTRTAVEGLPDARIASPSWSSDSRYLAFTLERDDRKTLWIFDT